MSKNSRTMSRRSFSALLGIAAASTLTSSLVGCQTDSPASGETGVANSDSDSGGLVAPEESQPVFSIPTGAVCVTEYATNTMAVFETDTNSLVARVPVGRNPAMMIRIADDLFIGSSGGGEIAAIALSDAAPVRRIRVGAQPLGLCFDETRQRLYVADYLNSSIHVVDPALDSMVGTIPLSRSGYHNRTDPPACCRKTTATGRRTVALELAPDDSILYCANYGTYDIARIDLEANTELEPFDGVVGPRALVMGRTGELVLAGVGGEESEKVHALAILNAASGQRIRDVPVGVGVADVCCTADGSAVYALSRDDGLLVAFDGDSWAETGRAEIGAGADALALSPDGSTVYCTNSMKGTMLVIDAATLATEFDISGLSSPKDVLVL